MRVPFKNLPQALRNRLYVFLVIAIALVIWDFYSMYQKITRQAGHISPTLALGLDTLTFLFLYLDVKQSKIYKSHFFKGLIFSGLIFLIGVLFYYNKWYDYTWPIRLSCALTWLTYCIYFIKKENRYRNDWLKMAWVSAACIGAILILQHTISPYFSMLSNVLFYAVFVTQLKVILQGLFQKITQNPYNQFR